MSCQSARDSSPAEVLQPNHIFIVCVSSTTAGGAAARLSHSYEASIARAAGQVVRDDVKKLKASIKKQGKLQERKKKERIKRQRAAEEVAQKQAELKREKAYKARHKSQVSA